MADKAIGVANGQNELNELVVAKGWAIGQVVARGWARGQVVAKGLSRDQVVAKGRVGVDKVSATIKRICHC